MPPSDSGESLQLSRGEATAVDIVGKPTGVVAILTRRRPATGPSGYTITIGIVKGYRNAFTDRLVISGLHVRSHALVDAEVPCSGLRNLRAVLAHRNTFECVGLQPEGVGEVDGTAPRETIEVQAAGEPDRIFLRETPDRTCVVGTERRKPPLLFFLAARLSAHLVVKRGLESDVHVRGGVGRGIGARLQSRDRQRGRRAPPRVPAAPVNITLGYVNASARAAGRPRARAHNGPMMRTERKREDRPDPRAAGPDGDRLRSGPLPCFGNDISS